MMANQWYCIAQTETFDSGCTINVSFDGYVIQFSASVRYGSSAINITRCNLPYDIIFSIRMRATGNKWFVDLYSNKEINPNITIADSVYWTSVGTPAGAGNIILVLNDITNKFNTSTGGDGNGIDIEQLKRFLADNGYTDMLGYWTKDDDVLKTTYNVVSTQEIIACREAQGGNTDSGDGNNGTTSYDLLESWDSYDESKKQALSATLGVDLNEKVKNLELNSKGYATLTNLNSLANRVSELEGYFSNGVAKDSEKLGGNTPSHYATASQVQEISLNLGSLQTRFDAHLEMYNEFSSNTDSRLNELEALELTLEEIDEVKYVRSKYTLYSKEELISSKNAQV